MDERRRNRPLYELAFPAPSVAGTPGDGPVLVHALEGFADAGHAVSIAATHLRDALDAEPIATFDTDELIDYRSRRPLISFSGTEFESVDMPELALHAVRDNAGTVFLLLAGSEPDLRWEQFTAAIRAIADNYGVSRVIGLHSIPRAVPHTRPSPITAHGSDEDALGSLSRWGAAMKLPSSASMLLELRLAEAGYKTAGLSVHVPHYLSQANYPGASAALLGVAGDVAGLDLPVAALLEAAGELREQVDREVASNPEIATVVAGLETQYDAYLEARGEQQLLAPDQQVPSGDEIGAEFERFLAEQAGDAGSEHPGEHDGRELN